MVENLWNDKIAAQFLDAAGDDDADRQLALRVYTSRIIGQDPELVMHGGGNTSVKVRRKDLFQNSIDVLHVKGSGWDLETIEAEGLPGVRMAPLADLRNLPSLSDEEMVNVQRSNLLDSAAPNPSVETLLHAYIPHKFVDHTHATAMLALANMPDVAKIVAEIFGARVVLVPYIMPGFELAKTAADIFDANPDVEGLLLVNHGHFTFSNTARGSYELMITHVNEVEAWFDNRTKSKVPAGRALERRTEILPMLRGALTRVMAKHTGNADQSAPVLDLRASDAALAFMQRNDIEELATRGVATPDHVIRTKGYPLVLTRQILADGPDGLERAIAEFADRYIAYFDRQNTRIGGGKTMLSPTPNLAWIEGLGLVGIGPTAPTARIAADLGEQTLQVMTLAEANGGFHSIGENDLFDMEYWSLEQAKLGKAKPRALEGKIVLVTGGAGAIGMATAKAFKAQGATLFLVDLDAAALETSSAILGQDHASFAVNLVQTGAAENAVEACVARFGGLDILVSNAGAAWAHDMASMPDDTLRNSFELNFFAHHHMAQAATNVLRHQGCGGQLLFNVSKQAVNPGKNFGAYGLPKAATFFLVKQLALELGANGIRVNGINADRIRSGLLTEEFIAQRSKSRNLDAKSYMAGNLLQREVEAHHVADAFVALALSERTTAHVMTVDGGNIEASLR